MVTAVQVKSIVKTFGAGSMHEVTALKTVSLTIEGNEFFTLLGPSGCGKTTMLRLIAGFEMPTSGEILLFGKHMEDLPPHQRNVNTVFQHYALFPHMSVAENVAFGLRRLRKSSGEIQKTVENMLDLVKLGELAERKPAQLSGGQQQRVALARALAPGPGVLLLDEPLSALDLKLRQAMRLELKHLQRETGITFIFVTHDQEEALSMSDRIAVMSNGMVQQVGTPQEIYEYPNSRFVAEFIGDANFMDARIVGLEPDHVVCQTKGGIFRAPLVEGFNVGDSVTIFLRPEKVSLHREGEGGDGLRGEVVDLVYYGGQTAYSVALGEGPTILVEDRNLTTGERRFTVGDRIGLRIDPETLRVLS
ncbi:MAG: ABC transporter ATP-binding protein [Rhodospirillaceae bacterium]|nr:ABC transporter ATP-binding protein [Rhodospirillaceae bacterium]